MEVKNKGKVNWKFKITLKEFNNNSYNKLIVIKNNCLSIFYLCYEYYFGSNKRYIKENMVKCINKIFRMDYIYNKIKSINIRYNNKIIYKSRAYNKVNKELEINIKNINYKKFRRIKKTNKFISFKRKFLNNNWNNFIENDTYPSNNIFLDPIMDKIEINILDIIEKPNNFRNRCNHQNIDINLNSNINDNKILVDADLINVDKDQKIVSKSDEILKAIME